MPHRHLQDSAARCRDYIARVPYSAALGLEMVEVGIAGCVLRLPFRVALADVHGGLANGAVSALLDNAGGMAVLSALSQPIDFSTLSLRVEFITAPTAGADVYARVQCLRLAGRQAHIRGSADCGDVDQPFAAVSGVFFLKPDRRPLYDRETQGHA